MTSGATPISAIIKVNGHLFLGAVQGAAAFWLWPSSLEWLGLGVLSILFGLSAFASVIAALRAMLKVYAREKEIARLAAASRAPEPSDLAGADALKKAGMFND